jgi:hypothetical protein
MALPALLASAWPKHRTTAASAQRQQQGAPRQGAWRQRHRSKILGAGSKVVGWPEASQTEGLGMAQSRNRPATGDNWSKGGRGVEIWGEKGSDRWGPISNDWRAGTGHVVSRVRFGFTGLAR